ncbi:hypothetical protein PBY51_016961 [Eleginops maclovinus]|uniref:Uncharacterized protein n=1 Tax=Eleginops maclovinus TaxID=56733 RepID=A0AAN7WRC6_ELEMC|nr:hypothetical protein PBY51_016961 [Eleginops maclovinus]
MEALIQGLWQSTQKPLAFDSVYTGVTPPLPRPPPEWVPHVLLEETNLQMSCSVMLRRRFSDPVPLLS